MNPNQICFVVMPFRTKSTGITRDGVPAQVDFDALWTKVYEPAVRAAGLEPIRADVETGSLILHQMIESLAFADLVLADVSIANANVYYEVGVRHGVPGDAERCLMVGADWAEPVFDLKQMRMYGFPLRDGAVCDAEAAVARGLVEAWVRDTALGGSPVRQIVRATNKNKEDRVRQFVQQARSVADAMSKIRAVGLLEKGARAAAARAVRDELLAVPQLVPGLRIELLKLVRDHIGWEETVTFIDTALSDDQRHDGFVAEQRLLAMGKSGDARAAYAALETLIRERGATSERYGLLGGRAKKVWQGGGADAGVWLDRAIEAYTAGMMADLNDYFPSCNLPRLLAQRNEPGDADARARAYAVATVACERARLREREVGADEWLRPTMLGLAFDAGDLAEATRLAKLVRNEGPAAWKLNTTLLDLRVTTEQLPEAVRPAFLGVIASLQALL